MRSCRLHLMALVFFSFLFQPFSSATSAFCRMVFRAARRKNSIPRCVLQRCVVPNFASRDIVFQERAQVSSSSTMRYSTVDILLFDGKKREGKRRTKKAANGANESDMLNNLSAHGCFVQPFTLIRRANVAQCAVIRVRCSKSPLEGVIPTAIVGVSPHRGTHIARDGSLSHEEYPIKFATNTIRLLKRYPAHVAPDSAQSMRATRSFAKQVISSLAVRHLPSHLPSADIASGRFLQPVGKIANASLRDARRRERSIDPNLSRPRSLIAITWGVNFVTGSPFGGIPGRIRWFAGKL